MKTYPGPGKAITTIKAIVKDGSNATVQRARAKELDRNRMLIVLHFTAATTRQDRSDAVRSLSRTGHEAKLRADGAIEVVVLRSGA